MLLAASVSFAQGQGVVEGRLINGTTPAKPAARIDVSVIEPASGMSVLESVQTDAEGRFRFDGLPASSPLLVRAEYRSVSYHQPLAFDGSGRAQVEIRIYETTTSMDGIRLDGLQLAFKLTDKGLRSLQSYALLNVTRPPQCLVREDGSFRFPKTPGLAEPPSLDVTGPGSNLPLTQAPLESADGTYYYSLYPLRPGVTTFEVGQLFPYGEEGFTYRHRFYQDVAAVNIGVLPAGMNLSGEGIRRVESASGPQLAVYSAGPFRAGTEVVWTFRGGAPIAEEPPPAAAQESQIRPMPTLVGRNALIIGPLLLIGLITILWYAHSRLMVQPADGREARVQELRDRREQLLNYAAALDARHERGELDRREYQRLREQCRRHLRRIAVLLAKRQP
jgi:hypothetical protein